MGLTASFRGPREPLVGEAPRLAAGLTEEIPRSPLYKISFAKYSLVLEHKIHVAWIVDQDPWRQGRNRQGECLVAILALALDKPREQLLPSLEEIYAISHDWQCVWRFPAPPMRG